MARGDSSAPSRSALKLAELEYIEGDRRPATILLLDDVLSDAQRRADLLDAVKDPIRCCSP
jgi:recombinational DNA repair ATPase RecF